MTVMLLAHRGINHALEGPEHPSFWAEHGVHVLMAALFLLAYLILLARERWIARRAHHD
ncbi:hypothetical protein HY374_01905 [Candidatus Berkelbacteria bacterium]|nr:hypothetical protein [Candidatus Berkelbacteria bacterium]